jgi:hypothetical protein
MTPATQRGRVAGMTAERSLQCAFGTRERADRFYAGQMLDYLNPAMIEFVERNELAFIATADARGHPDCSVRSGPPGFLHVLDSKRLAYPEYPGNGVMASLGNLTENPSIGMILVDGRDVIGLHVNGPARIVRDAYLRAARPSLPGDQVPGRAPEVWVVVTVHEAYIQCRKHLPRIMVERQAGESLPPAGDYFRVRADN